MKVAIVILNWNGSKDTINCLNSLKKLRGNFEVFLVDNFSAENIDGGLSRLPTVDHFIQNVENFGFAGGNNSGILAALICGFDAIWLLNNDTEVDINSLNTMLSCFSDERVGIVGSTIVDIGLPHRVQALGGGYINFNLGISRHITNLSEIRRLNYISGASMLLRAKMIREIGLLDHNYFMYWEDVEYSYRAKLNGWEIVYAPESIVYHKESPSIGRFSIGQVKFYNSSVRRFFLTYSSLPVLPIFFGSVGRSIRAIWRRQWRALPIIWGLSE